jgi:anti-anti-sigma factor
MTFQTHIEGDQAVIRSVEESRHFRPLSEVKRVLSLGVKTITVDLRDVSFVDSAGIGELITSHVYANETGSHLLLINVTPDVRRYLDLANLGELLDIHECEPPSAAAGPEGTAVGEQSASDPTGTVSTTMRVGTSFSSRVLEARLAEHEGRQTLIVIIDGDETPMSPGKTMLAKLELLEATDEERQALRDAGYEGSLRFL